MKKDKVLFMYHEKNEDLFAVFPDIIADRQGNLTAYSHIGQHSACSKEYVNESRKATKEEKEDLFKELLNIGYNIL